jgi:hypothetical protein
MFAFIHELIKMKPIDPIHIMQARLLTFWSPGLDCASPGHAPPTVIAKNEPKPMCAPETMPSLKIFDHDPAALAAPAATAPS